MVLALLPFAGLGWFSVQALERAADRVDAAAQIETRTPEVIRLAVLDSSLASENYWSSAIASIEALGIPNEFIADLIGVDILSELEQAQAEVDAYIDDPGLDEVRDLLATARTLGDGGGATTTAINEAYTRVSAALAVPIQGRIEDLARRSNDVPDSYLLSRTTQALATAVDVRTMSSGVAFGYFASRYPGAAAEAEPALNLIGWTANYESEAARLDRLLDPGTAPFDVWEEVKADPRVVELLDRAQGFNAAIVDSDSDEPFLSAVNLANIDIEREAAAFTDSLIAVDLHLGVVDAVGEELADIAGVVRADAEAFERTMVATTAVVVLLSVVAAALAGRWIVRPLRRMAEVVTAMREGELGSHVVVAGPNEVRTAARALNEAADNLKLAEVQAAALADADLDHEALERTPPGRLGASLQSAVRRLAASLSERETLQRQLQHEATHDGLTGLVNRSAAMDALERSLARTRREDDRDLAVMYIDVDEFKQINDRFGHNAGDLVLRSIADRMTATIREGDLACRLGGDEFLMIAEPVRDAHEAMIVANRLLAAVGEPIALDTAEIRPGISIGVALAGRAGLSADELLRDADLAVYRAKHEGRSRVELCDVELRSQIAERMDVEDALRQAVECNELVVHYQPVVGAEDDALVSLEALVRWDRPGLGLVPPDDFVPVAERSHLIISIDNWVLAQVVRQLAEWSEHPVLHAIPVAVNVSARHLSGGGLAGQVLGLLDGAGVDPGRLSIELTESALLDDLDAARDQLEALRERGVKVALDDFGTGYTSLAHLRELPVDAIKVDKSFVHNLDRVEDRSLVELIVKTGQILGVSVTAEGVETLEQATDLSDMGSDHLQGFRYSSPMDATALESSLVTDRISDR